MLLNCNFAQTLHDMPSGLDGGPGHLRHLGHLSQRLDNMPSGCMDSSDLPSHLGLLGHLGYLNALDPKPIDIPLYAFIEEEGST
jgi:hypothetical protein